MATGITEKNNNGLFENEVELNGKYATMARALKEEYGVFSTFRELYVLAAILGYVNQKKETEDKTPKVNAASIFPGDLNKRRGDLRFIYRIMMLTDDIDGYTINDYMDRAFRDDEDQDDEGNINSDKTLKEKMKVFNSYACGGIEYLFEKIQGNDNQDKIIDIIYDIVHKFAVDVELLEDDTLVDFTPEYD